MSIVRLPDVFCRAVETGCSRSQRVVIPTAPPRGRGRTCALAQREPFHSQRSPDYSGDVYLGGPPWLYAFILAVVAGVLLAIGEYVGGGIAAALAVGLMAAWQRASPED